MFYGRVFKALNKARVKYVVAGGVAVVLHGYRRHTDDLDLMVLMEERNLDKLFMAIKSAGYSPKVPVTKEQFKDPQTRKRWKKEKRMIVFSFVENDPPFKLIDIFVDEPVDFEEVYRKRVLARIKGVIIPFMAIEHLTILKKRAGRAQDLIDIEQLKYIDDKNEKKK